MEDEGVDGIFITGFFGGFKDIIAPHVAELEEQASRDMVDLVATYKKPLFVHTSFARDLIKSLDILKTAGVPVIESSERTAQCLSALMRFSMNQRKISQMHMPLGVEKDRPAVNALFKKVKEERRNNLLETESRELLNEYGIPLPEAMFADSAEKAIEMGNKVGFPLAMKIVSPDIIHKSDAGGIKLNLKGETEVHKAFDEIVGNGEKVTARDRILGTLISPMVAHGQECIIGMIRDRQFGPVIMFGLGGIFVEVLKDVSFRVAPLAAEDIDEMIREIKGYKILTGIRGEKPKDIDAIKDILTKLSQIATENPEIIEIDLNPVIVHERGASIVDSRVILG
jgi:acyl-CoA synthetase (NDP forming)